MESDLVFPLVSCRQCGKAMNAWGESAEVWVCRNCGTCKDSDGWQVPKVTEYLERPEVLLSVPRRWRMVLSELVHGEELAGDQQ